jgi:hypothetical protein
MPSEAVLRSSKVEQLPGFRASAARIDRFPHDAS